MSLLQLGGHDLSRTLKRFDGYIMELVVTNESVLMLKRWGQYLDILKAKKSTKEACSASFCLLVAVRAKHLQLLLLYYSFNHEQQRAQQQFQSFNSDVWLM